MAATSLPTRGRLPSRMTKFGVGRAIGQSPPVSRATIQQETRDRHRRSRPRERKAIVAARPSSPSLTATVLLGLRDDLGQVAGQPLAFGFGHAAPPQQGSAFPDTGQNTLMLP